jgi:cell division protein FtsB
VRAKNRPSTREGLAAENKSLRARIDDLLNGSPKTDADMTPAMRRLRIALERKIGELSVEVTRLEEERDALKAELATARVYIAQLEGTLARF